MATINLVTQHPALYKGKAEWALIDVPVRRMLRLEGSGSPAAPEWSDAVGALYSVAYSLKFAWKKAGLDDFTVPCLEGLWDIRRANSVDDADWVALLPVPDHTTDVDIAAIVELVAKKKPNPRLADLRIVDFDEGLSLQRLFVGPYRDEAPVIADLHSRVIPEMGLTETGWHHEVYLSDPNRTAPDKLRTLLRQPVARKV